MMKSLPKSVEFTSRRHFIVGSSIAAISAMSGWPSSAVAQPAMNDAFLTLSKNLTNTSLLDEDIAAAMLEAFGAIGKDKTIIALSEGKPDAELENDIIAAWYSGVSPNPDANEVLAYTDALMWEAMSYTKPMGYCGGGMGYWSEPPAA